MTDQQLTGGECWTVPPHNIMDIAQAYIFASIFSCDRTDRNRTELEDERKQAHRIHRECGSHIDRRREEVRNTKRQTAVRCQRKGTYT